ncbi:MAG: exodeoxyribonuclease III [Nitratireductor sp.]|nr:exodeoxyribonuclease III [Nitratireductor sp.]MCC0021896.1 exodeoxyribonuclease III [Nitratireductor sp.]
MAFKLATWNINSVRLRAGLVEDFLNSHQPDILCLQEIKCMNDQFPAKVFRKLGYEHQAVHGQKGYHGVATVSKRPIHEYHSTDYCLMGDTRHLCTRFELGGRPVDLHNFYVPAGGDEPDPAINPKFDHKLKFIEEMKGLKSNRDGVPGLLVGDLNIAPLESDVWSHKQLLKIVSHTPVETDGLKDVMAKGEWVDVVRRHFPEDQVLYSWWSYRAKDWKASNRGRRLDHVWSHAELADHLSNVEIFEDARGWEKASDHVPVIATFDLE